MDPPRRDPGRPGRLQRLQPAGGPARGARAGRRRLRPVLHRVRDRGRGARREQVLVRHPAVAGGRPGGRARRGAPGHRRPHRARGAAGAGRAGAVLVAHRRRRPGRPRRGRARRARGVPPGRPAVRRGVPGTPGCRTGLGHGVVGRAAGPGAAGGPGGGRHGADPVARGGGGRARGRRRRSAGAAGPAPRRWVPAHPPHHQRVAVVRDGRDPGRRPGGHEHGRGGARTGRRRGAARCEHPDGAAERAARLHQHRPDARAGAPAPGRRPAGVRGGGRVPRRGGAGLGCGPAPHPGLLGPAAPGRVVGRCLPRARRSPSPSTSA